MENKLTYLHDQILFNGESVENLNSVQRGELQDFIDEIPSDNELYEIKESADKFNKLIDDINNLIKQYRDSYNNLLNDPAIDKKDLLNDIINSLSDLF